MISCTEFIYAYSELFKFLDARGGKAEVERYWAHISDTYVADRLGEAIENDGLKGCYLYWSRALKEEAADYKLTYDEAEGLFTIEMFGCPSRAMLNRHPEMSPYPHYCGHCDLLYRRVVERYGMRYDIDFSHVDEARCRIDIRTPKP